MVGTHLEVPVDGLECFLAEEDRAGLLALADDDGDPELGVDLATV
jgi:hypothetical protein